MSTQPRIKVLYFATASTVTGKSDEYITLPHDGMSLNALAEKLKESYPDGKLGKVLDSSQWSVDEEMVEDPSNTILKGGEEVAVIPPVSGG